MIYIFHGKNPYENEQSLKKEIKDRDLTVIQGDELSDLNSIFLGTDNFSLFSSAPKPILVKRFFQNRKKSLQEKLLVELEKGDCASYEMYFWEPKQIDKRLRLYKFFKKNCKVVESSLPKSSALIKWLINTLKGLKIDISNTLARELIEKAGTDQHALFEECNKMSLYLTSHNRSKVLATDLNIVSLTTKEKEIWDLLDFIAGRNKKMALKQINLLVKTPSDFPYVVVMIARQLRILYLLISKDISRDSLTQDLKLHPFVIQKASKYLYKFDEPRIKMLYAKIVDLDFAIKQGRIDAILGLNLFIASI